MDRELRRRRWLRHHKEKSREVRQTVPVNMHPAGMYYTNDDAPSITPEKKLAVAILLLAVRDVWVAGHRKDALKFFEGPDLEFWCHVAGIHPDRVRSEVRRLSSERRYIPSALVQRAKPLEESRCTSQ